MKSAFLVMTSLWLSGSVSAAETLPVVKDGHQTKGQAPDAKGGDAKGQDAKGGKAAQAPQAPCHECKISLLDKLKARLGSFGGKCNSCEVSHSKGQAPDSKGADKAQDAKGGKGADKAQDAKGGKGADKAQDAKGGKGADKAQDAKGAKAQDPAKGQAPQAPCHECKVNFLDKLKARLSSLNMKKCGCEASGKGQAPETKGCDKGQDAGKGGKGKDQAPMPAAPAKAAPAKQVSTVPAIPELKNPF